MNRVSTSVAPLFLFATFYFSLSFVDAKELKFGNVDRHAFLYLDKLNKYNYTKTYIP